MLRKIIREGGYYPKGYGRAWDDWSTLGQPDNVAVICYPVPLNLLFRWARNCWWWLHRGWRREFARERFERQLAANRHMTAYTDPAKEATAPDLILVDLEKMFGSRKENKCPPSSE